MSETFYTELGVGADADTETVQRAYRELVKDTHPDVSDNPDATRSFKRLTTARDVLSDERERRRYDRLGHTTYVKHHAKETVWSESLSETATSGERTPRQADTGTQHTSGVSWQQTRRQTQATTDHASQSDGSETNSRTDGGNAARGSWQTASAVYRQSPINVETDSDSLLRSMVAGVRELGAWFVVHVVLILSALATTWFTMFASRGMEVSPAILVGIVLLVPLVVTLSVVHILLVMNS